MARVVEEEDEATAVTEDDVYVTEKEQEPAAEPWEPSVWRDSLMLGSVHRVMRTGGKRELHFGDLPRPLAAFRSTDAKFDAETQALWDAAKGKKSLVCCLLQPCMPWVYVASFVGALQGLMQTVGRFLALRLVITVGLGDSATMQTRVALVALVGGMVLVEGLLGVISKQLISGTIAHSLVARASVLIARQIGRMGASSDAETSAETSAFFSGDVPRVLSLASFIALIPTGISALFGGVGVLLYFLGPSALVGLASMVVFMGGSAKLGNESKRIEPLRDAARDIRLGQLRQMIEGLRAVKFYAWEDEYAEMIQDSRLREVAHIKKYRRYMQASVCLGKAFPVIAAMLTIISAAAARGGRIDAADAFATIAVFQTLRVGMIMLPLSAVLLNACLVVFDRLEAFLRIKPHDKTSNFGSNIKEILLIRNLKVTHDALKRSFELDIPELGIERGKIYALVGRVASGKSTLVDAIFGELPSSGTITWGRTKSGLSPQKPFVCSGTLVENVCMGRAFSEQRFKEACSIADLHRDLAHLPEGRDTVVGERGVTLSGGQQHRISIARAVYGQPDLLVLDGSLAAVDPRVAGRIFDQLDRYVRADPRRSAILILSQLHLLSRCDEVICLADGQIASKGSYQELLKQRGPFAEFCRAYQQTKEQEGDATPLLMSPEVVKEQEGDAAQLLTSPEVVKEQQEEEKDASLLMSPEAVQSGKEDVGALLMSPEAVQSGKERDTSLLMSPEAVQSGKEREEGALLMSPEAVQSGTIKGNVVWDWARSCGFGLLTMVLLGYLSSSVVLGVNDLFLSKWTRANGNYQFYMALYASLSIAYLILIFGAMMALNEASARGSSRIHEQCVLSLLASPMAFFDRTPSGRILSRFSADMEGLDLHFTNASDAWLTMLAMSLMLVVVISAVIPILIPVNFGVVVCLGVHIRRINKVNREVRRLSNTSVSPVVTNAAEMETGRVVARSMGTQDFFLDRHRENMDVLISAFFTSNAVKNLAFAVAQVYCFFIAAASVGVVLLAPSMIKPGLRPIALAYAAILPYFAGMVCDCYLQVTTSLTSLERLFEYLPGRLESEKPRHEHEVDDGLEKSWPTHGSLKFENVELRYRPGLPLSLRGASFELRGGERCGVVGRTGAGKSTVMIALFRLVEVESGRITIDGVDLSTLGLRLLRQRVAMIPQEPVILEGTARSNIDPFNQRTDDECETALASVGLHASLLNQRISADASLSIGERQLLAIARVLVRGAKVVCMDEPTAHVDAATDAQIQNVVKTQFNHSTFLTIAHRLHTIIDYDKTLVLDAGRVVQFGTPSALLDDDDGPFAQMVNHLGPNTKAKLREKATGSAE